MDKFREYTFLTVVFFLGTASLFGIALSLIFIPLIAINASKNLSLFWQNLKKEKLYIFLPIAFCIYLLLHFAFKHFFLDYNLKPSFSYFEIMLCYFFIIPLYVLSVKPYINEETLKKALPLFGWGVLIFNIVLIFIQIGSSLFTSPTDILDLVHFERLGGNKHLGALHMMLEPQSMILSISAIVSIFAFLIKKKISTAILALLLILLLFFTLSKGAILAFFAGAVFCVVYTLRLTSAKNRLVVRFGILATLLVLISLLLIPQGATRRIKDTTSELKNLANHKLGGGSLSPRIVLWECAYEHRKQYIPFGVGVYSEAETDNWFLSLQNDIVKVNMHNSFIEYLVMGGLAGLAFLIFYFILPIVRMQRQKKWSLLVLSGLTIIFITNNTCVLFSLSNTLTNLLFWLAMFYFYAPLFASIEKKECLKDTPSV